MITVKFLSENSNIYYLGENEEYSDENMLYHNNLISMNGSNEPKYCFTSDKDNNTLKLCNDYDMVTIKSDIIKDDITLYLWKIYYQKKMNANNYLY